MITLFLVCVLGQDTPQTLHNEEVAGNARYEQLQAWYMQLQVNKVARQDPRYLAYEAAKAEYMRRRQDYIRRRDDVLTGRVAPVPAVKPQPKEKRWKPQYDKWHVMSLR